MNYCLQVFSFIFCSKSYEMKNIKLKDIRILQSVSFIHWAATSTAMCAEHLFSPNKKVNTF